MWVLNKSTGQAQQVTSIPAGAGVITWGASGMPPDLANALGNPAGSTPVATPNSGGYIGPTPSSTAVGAVNTTPTSTSSTASTVSSSSPAQTSSSGASYDLTPVGSNQPSQSNQVAANAIPLSQFQGYNLPTSGNFSINGTVYEVNDGYVLPNPNFPANMAPDISTFAAPSTSTTGATSTTGTTTGTGTTGTSITGNANLDSILNAFNGVAQNLISSGYTIPTTLQITPALVQQFISYAHQAVDPQTQQLIQNEATNINASLSNMATQFNNQQAQTAQDFGVQVASQDNTMAGNGTAFSGLRNLTDLNTANTANRTLASNAANTSYNIGNLLRTGAADVGSANAGALTAPTLNGTTVSLAGGSNGSNAAGPALNFNYDPSQYTVGNIPTSQNTAVNNLAGNYLDQYSTLAGNNSNGTKSINDLLGMMTGLPAGYAPYSGSTTTAPTAPSTNLM